MAVIRGARAPRGRLTGLLPVVTLVASVLLAAATVSPAQDEVPALELLNRFSVSRSGFIEVASTNRAANQSILKWAEDVVTRTETLTGRALRGEGWRLRLSLRDRAGSGGALSITNEPAGALLLRRLVVVNVSDVDVEVAAEAVCRCLLDAYVAESAPVTNATPFAVVPVPYWLSLGVAQNLFPASRARNAGALLRRWQDGSLPPLPDLLARLERMAPPDAGAVLDDTNRFLRAASGVFADWLLDEPHRGVCFGDALSAIASGRRLAPADLLPCVGGSGTAVEWDEAWDRRLLGQRRVVYAPGRADGESLDLVRRQLLLYAGDSGIPLQDGKHVRIDLRDLVAHRDEPWARAVGEGRAVAVRMAAVGRGAAIDQVAEAYGVFFELLARGASARRLEAALREAEAALAGASAASGDGGAPGPR